MSGARGGFVLVLVAASCFGTVGVFSKLFYDAGGESYTLLFLRFAVTAPALALLAGLRGERLPQPRVVVAGLALGALQLGAAYALFEGFSRAPVALVTLLYFAYPLVTAVAAALLFGEEFGPGRVAILALALTGIALTIGVPDAATWVGVVLGLLAGLCVSALILCSRRLLTRYAVSPLGLAALMFAGPALALALAIPGHEPDLALSGEAWGWAMCTVVVGAIVPIGLFYTGVQRLEAGVVGLLSSVEPLVTVVLAYIVLDESLTVLQLLGGALIVASVVALSVRAAGGRTGRTERAAA